MRCLSKLLLTTTLLTTTTTYGAAAIDFYNASTQTSISAEPQDSICTFERVVSATATTTYDAAAIKPFKVRSTQTSVSTETQDKIDAFERLVSFKDKVNVSDAAELLFDPALYPYISWRSDEKDAGVLEQVRKIMNLMPMPKFNCNSALLFDVLRSIRSPERLEETLDSSHESNSSVLPSLIDDTLRWGHYRNVVTHFHLTFRPDVRLRIYLELVHRTNITPDSLGHLLSATTDLAKMFMIEPSATFVNTVLEFKKDKVDRLPSEENSDCYVSLRYPSLPDIQAEQERATQEILDDLTRILTQLQRSLDSSDRVTTTTIGDLFYAFRYPSSADTHTGKTQHEKALDEVAKTFSNHERDLDKSFLRANERIDHLTLRRFGPNTLEKIYAELASIFANFEHHLDESFAKTKATIDLILTSFAPNALAFFKEIFERIATHPRTKPADKIKAVELLIQAGASSDVLVKVHCDLANDTSRSVDDRLKNLHKLLELNAKVAILFPARAIATNATVDIQDRLTAASLLSEIHTAKNDAINIYTQIMQTVNNTSLDAREKATYLFKLGLGFHKAGDINKGLAMLSQSIKDLIGKINNADISIPFIPDDVIMATEILFNAGNFWPHKDAATRLIQWVIYQPVTGGCYQGSIIFAAETAERMGSLDTSRECVDYMERFETRETYRDRITALKAKLSAIAAGS